MEELTVGFFKTNLKSKVATIISKYDPEMNIIRSATDYDERKRLIDIFKKNIELHKNLADRFPDSEAHKSPDYIAYYALSNWAHVVSFDAYAAYAAHNRSKKNNQGLVIDKEGLVIAKEGLVLDKASRSNEFIIADRVISRLQQG